eukprot:Pompholyxophrys_punicea_v1_NODE_571_length_1672_cov_15.557823.p1 type:complete len:423 gc:universal NODE_571_length_1672_cov_15.557823:1356-88(-)
MPSNGEVVKMLRDHEWDWVIVKTKFDQFKSASKLKKFSSLTQKKWQKAKRTLKRFEAQNEMWLQAPYEDDEENEEDEANSDSSVEDADIVDVSSEEEEIIEGSARSGAAVGRKKKPWHSLDIRTKQLRTAGLRTLLQNTPEEELNYCLGSTVERVCRMSAVDGLVFLVDCDLTKGQYQKIINNAKSNGLDFYPPYNDVGAAKKETYPEATIINEISAYTPLQQMIDKSVKRFYLGLRDVFDALISRNIFQLTFIWKWGFDGATGQSAFKQSWDHDADHKSDASLFVTSLTPLRLFSSSFSDVIVWNNPRPSSEIFCRPLRLQFLKESDGGNTAEEAFWKSEISKLAPTKIVHDGKDFLITHKLLMTMIDGKVVSHLTDIHTTNCTLCGCTPSLMNNLNYVVTRPVNTDFIEYGLSSMHLWIR